MVKNYECIKENLIKGLQNNYNIEREASVLGDTYDLKAEYNVRNSKYVMTKKVEVYAFRSEEKIYFKEIKNINRDFLKLLRDKIKEDINKLISVDDEHMSTELTFIFACEDISKETVKKIEKFKYHKDFKFGLRGWANVKLFVYDLHKGILYSNKYGKGSKKEMNRVFNL